MNMNYLPDSDMDGKNLYWIILTLTEDRTHPMWATMVAETVDEVSDRIVEALNGPNDFVAFRDTILRVDSIESYQIRKYRGRDFT